MSFQDSLGEPTKVPYTEFTAQVEQHNVAEVFSQGDTIEGTLREPKPVPDQDDPGKTYDRFTTERPTYAQDDLLTQLKAGGATVSATPLTQDRGIFWNLLIAFAPILLLFGFWFWLFRRAQAMGGGAGMFGVSTRKKKPVDPESVRVTFDDVAGIDEVKDEINEIVDYLRNPEKYRKLGAKVPKGVLLTGPPGTGKTLLARATAGEANVPFFSASGAEFIEMIVGVGASRVRELFEEARKVAPSIIFIDEIDTIGRSRSSAASVGGHDEREQTLNQILTEMDGFSGSEGVVVLAATNRPDILDPALLRPGRFDRRVAVNPPDRKGRVEILRVHTRSVPLADDVDLDRLAAATPGMTGADLANLVNEAALAAARDGQTEVTDRDLFEALEKVQLGTARSVVLPEEDRRRTAYHEAGHALLGMLQPGADPVRKVSIIPRGHALGVTLSTPDEDRYGYTAEYLRGRIIGALGGMAAEEEVYGVVTTGSESDLETATNLARGMVGRWGMSERIGPVSVLPKEGDPRMAGISDSMLGAVDQEVRRLIDGCYAEARELLRNNRDRLDSIVAELLVHETLDEDAVYAAAGISREAVVRA
ncbi:cell division protein FtsH [Mycolicibacterium elephantis]|nr:cell division protein FtsH [Mycolicibacterium elephantis]OBB17595.1 cell division protein FtsH [Mycolicibacterium elephantis]OBF00139.1 cell division protein FtsH [Mycolicibacterium elephantis]